MAVKQSKRKTQNESTGLQDQLREKSSEIEVLKEMVRGTKLQLKSKDTDIQRLNIKIRRLEKTNEIREDMINSIALNIKNGKDIDPNMIMQPSQSSKSPGAPQLKYGQSPEMSSLLKKKNSNMQMR